MTSIFMKQGSTYWPTNDEQLDVHGELPVGTYSVGYNTDRGFYFEPSDAFTMPPKLYGDTEKRAARVINTFHERPASTGIILSGEKGSGKTLLTKKISLELAKQGIITIIVNMPYHGELFNRLMQTVRQPALIFFDEFEKVYEKHEDQNALLTLFDGLTVGKKLFAITCNKKDKLSEFFLNRPGRFLYAFNYKGIEEDFIRSYLEDNLKNKKEIENFLQYTSAFDAFSFDMLQSLTEEMNRYDETVQEASKFVNVSIDSYSRFAYDVIEFKSFKFDANKVSFKKNGFNGGMPINIFTSQAYIYFQVEGVEETDDFGENNIHVSFTSNDIVGISVDNVYTLKNEEAEIKIRKRPESEFDFFKYLTV